MTSRRSIPWSKLPPEVKDEVDEIVKRTSKSGKENSITLCKKSDRERLFVGNNYAGGSESTLALNCDARFGKSSQIGTVHTHPRTADTIGILQSEADIYANLADTSEHKRTQIGCVAAPKNEFINCNSPKAIPTRQKLRTYEKALGNSRKRTDPYFLDNFSRDFEVALFDRDTGNREDNPDPKLVIKSAFGQSNKALRNSIKTLERGTFCEYVADLMGQHHRDEVILECKNELRRRSFLGLFDY